MTKPKSKSKMIKALFNWNNSTCNYYHFILIEKSKSEITKLFNEAITNKQKGNYNV